MSVDFLKLHTVDAVTLQVPWRWAMATSNDERLQEFAQWGVCPHCGSPLIDGDKFPRGKGVFCSFDCMTLFNEFEFMQKAEELKNRSGKNYGG
jgi:hypothetical protein